MEENKPRTIPWLAIIIIIIIILAGVQWWQVSHSENTPDSTNATTTATTNTSIMADASAAQSVQANVEPITNSSSQKNFMHTITLETNKGTIIFQTYDADAPKTSANFVTLAEKGFYDNLIFHRVIDGFMIQGGDPTGTGMGGPGYKFADELNSTTDSYKVGYVRGTVAMANSGPNTNGSQFFIMQKDYPLGHNYTIFGKVIQGLDVVDAIVKLPQNSANKPTQDVVIKKVTVKSNQ